MGESFGRSGSLEEVKLGLEEEISFIRLVLETRLFIAFYFGVDKRD